MPEDTTSVRGFPTVHAEDKPAEPQQEAPKRKRGRPRKNPLPQEPQQEAK